jgi:large subunit GTPase 1
MGAHKVAVGATPGKTKHFQTFHLDETMILCDCPGLVFPSFATTKADMVCNGILPIDQMREYLGPAGLVAQRLPKEITEAVYGITIRLFKDDEESLAAMAEKKALRSPTAEELLVAFALARGYTKASQGNPDEARAARHILKDYVQGKLLFVHPPPGREAKEFNAALYTNERYIAKKKKEAELAAKEELAVASGQKVISFFVLF